MTVTVIGGWENDTQKNKAQKNEIQRLDIDDGTKQELQEFCRILGRLLASRKHEVFVGSDDEDRSVDPYIVQGMGQYLVQQQDPLPLIRTIQGIDSNKRLYGDPRYREFESLFRPYPPPLNVDHWPRAAAKIASVQEADVVIAIAGLTDTYIAGIAALVARKPLVPVAVLGGASRQLFYARRVFGEENLPEDWDQLHSSRLDERLAQTVLRLGGLDRTNVFLGYCSQASATALRVRDYLEALGLRVIDWARDFKTGQVILREIQRAARLCKYGIFLFTPDDAVVTEPGKSHMVPRDNVVFEAGYFMNSHGPKRTAIIVQGDTKVLADYAGYIHLAIRDPEDISPIKQRLREVFGDDSR
jgi:hypothetical protein